MHAILLAPVDLLWNGGIGTYVKASHRGPRRRRRQGQRRHPGRRRATCGPRSSARAATSASPSSAASSPRCCGGAGQHRRHRQLGRRRHLRPRGQHQDPARRGRCAPGELTTEQRNELLGDDDRRGRRARAARQLRAERAARQRPCAGARRCSACTSASSTGSRTAASSTGRWSSCPTDAELEKRVHDGLGPDVPGVLGARRLRQDRAQGGHPRELDLPDDPYFERTLRRLLPARDPRALRRPSSPSHPLRREIVTNCGRQRDGQPRRHHLRLPGRRRRPARPPSR